MKRLASLVLCLLIVATCINPPASIHAQSATQRVVHDETGLREALAGSYDRIIIGTSFTLDSLRQDAIPNGRRVEICGFHDGTRQTLTFDGYNTNGITVGPNREVALSNIRLIGAGAHPGAGIMANVAGEPRVITLNNVEIMGFTNAGIRATQDGITINMHGDTLVHGNVSGTGGGVNIQRDVVFNMYDGRIHNNEASTAGGVNVSDYATFNMHGGYISSNLTTSNTFGGGVHLVNGTFNMYGGTITGNMASVAGGIGAGRGSTITMHPGAVIYGNYAGTGGQGGGVRLIQASRFYMNGGQIIGNTSVTSGGGVQVGGDSVFQMSGGTISGNIANVGGGVSVSGLFNMTGGTITNNTAADVGGGVRILASGELNINDTNRVFNNTSDNFHGSFTSVPYVSVEGLEPRRLPPHIRPPLASRPPLIPELAIQQLNPHEEGLRRHFVSGYPDGTFRADGHMTRAEMMQVFFNISPTGGALVFSPNIHFSDVSTDDWFFSAASYLVNRGIIQGFPDGTLRPNEPITHAEFATLAAMFFGLGDIIEPDTLMTTGDHWGARFINLTLARGWLEYFEITDTFNPDAPIPRAQAVALLNFYQGRAPNMGAINRYLIGSDRVVFPDLQRGLWSFYEVMEAAFTRYYYFDADYREIWSNVLN
ncbi:MAG: S-layer homology domain-containing protein [Defluviitaleaceae bacterium]|nr:S-layer homology domain-containing protein [Defluviitaleaceae bacterium]